MTDKGQKQFSYWILVLPAVLIYLLIVAFPTVFSIFLSFTSYNGGKIFGNPNLKITGLDSYIWMFTEPTGDFYRSLGNNMLIVLVSVFGQIPVGFALAYVLARKLIKKGRSFFQTMIFLPYVISPVIIGVLFNVFILSQYSALMEIRQMIDPTAVFALSKTPILPVLFVILWMFVGFYMIVFMAHMQRIDPAIDEAARIDGAREAQILWHIILPSMKNEIITCAILAISGSLRTFDLVYAMTAGGPAGMTRVLSLYMYNSAFHGAPNYPLANAISTVMVLISVALIIITQALGRYFNRKDA